MSIRKSLNSGITALWHSARFWTFLLGNQTCVIVKFGQHFENADSSVNVGISPAANLFPPAFSFSPIEPKSITLFLSGSDIPIDFFTEVRLKLLFFSDSAFPNALFSPANIFQISVTYKELLEKRYQSAQLFINRSKGPQQLKCPFLKLTTSYSPAAQPGRRSAV